MSCRVCRYYLQLLPLLDRLKLLMVFRMNVSSVYVYDELHLSRPYVLMDLYSGIVIMICICIIVLL